MKKSLKTILIVAAVMLAVGMLLMGAAFLMGARPWQISLPSWSVAGTGIISGYRNWDSAWSPEGSYAADAKELSAIDLQWISGSVSVTVDGTDTVRFSETGASTEAEALRWGVENGVLYIQYCANRSFTQLPEKDLSLSIPEELAAALSAFCFDSSSAGLAVSDVEAKSFHFDSSSGVLSAENIAAEDLRLSSGSGKMSFSGTYKDLDADSSSGEVIVESLGSAERSVISTSSGNISLSGDFGKLQIDTSSGRIDARGPVIAKELHCSTTSGEISLSGSFGAVEIDSSSGAVGIASAVCPEALDVESSSGHVTLTLPGDSGFTLRYDSSAGQMSSELSMVIHGQRFVCGDGGADFRVSSSSGDLSIRQG